MNGKSRPAPLRIVREEGRAPSGLPPGRYLASRGSDLPCPNCGRTFVRRSHRRGLWEHLCSFLLIYPYRCQLCAHRFLAAPRHTAGRAHREFARLQVRFPSSFWSAYLDQTLSGDATVTTLSIRGCSLITAQPPARGCFLRLHIRFAEEEAPIGIEVAVIRSVSSRRLGVEFLSLKPEQEARLRRLLEHLLYGRFR